jgi:hypothetical protein
MFDMELFVGWFNEQKKGLTQCTTPRSDHVNNWYSRLIALEGMMAQIFAIMTKTNSPLVTPSDKEQKEVPKVQSQLLKISHDLKHIFECLHDLPTVDTNGLGTPNGVLVRFFTTLWVPMIIKTSLWYCDYTWEEL